MNENDTRRRRRIPPVLGVAAAFALAGCVETELQGVILNEDIDQPDLLLPLVRGVNSELTDNFRGINDGVPHITAVATDEVTNDGTDLSEERLSVAEYSTRPGEFAWEQLHEAAWAGYHALSIIEEVLGAEATESSPLTAQALVVSGWSERMLGETFCEVVYNYGPDSGPLYEGEGQARFDPSGAVSRDSAFVRSVTAFERALAIAEAALATGEEAPDGDPIFDPQRLVYKAHGGLAQAYADLGQWDLAAQHASQVPDDFVAYEYQDEQAEDNQMYNTFYENDDITLWNTPAVLLWPDDPRVPFTRCGEFEDGPRTEPGDEDDIEDLDCGSPSGEYRAESNTIPMYRSDKYTSSDDDVAMVRGAEMRLIRAEAALVAGDLGGFTIQINAARDIYGLAPIEQPASAGALEYPNAEDDAWSILDRERYLTLHLEGRRYWDFERWDHPFVSQNTVMTTRLLEEFGSIARASCFPIADIECDANGGLPCPTLGG